jgi:hypothetical protein
LLRAKNISLEVVEELLQERHQASAGNNII